MTTTIYGLSDPRDGQIHYVGQTNKAARRLIEHRNEHGRVNAKKSQWLEDLQAEGLEPLMTVLEMCDDEEADARELYWINHGREHGWPLVNKAHGYETTERKLDALIEKAVRLGVLPVYTASEYSLKEKKRVLPFIVQQAEEKLQHLTDIQNVARKQEAEITEYLTQVEEFVHGPEYS